LGRSCLRWSVTILFFGLVTLILSTWLELSVFKKRKDSLTTELRETFKGAFPGAKRIVDEVRQAKNFLNAERKNASGNTTRLDSSVLNALRAISRAIPEGTSFEIVSLFWERGKVEIYGKTDSFKTVNVIQEALAGNQNFSEVTISNAKMISEGQDVEFKVSILLAG
jgi:type II secretory pathway component PulL